MSSQDSISLPLPGRSGDRPKFRPIDGFQSEVRRRVDAFFASTGRRPRDNPSMYLKTVLILGAFVASYVVLVFLATNWWEAVAAALVLGGSAGLIGFNIQHDGSHLAYSDRPFINKLTAMSMDLIGASSYMWHWKHVASHHASNATCWTSSARAPTCGIGSMSPRTTSM